MPVAIANPARSLLDGGDHALVPIDFQSQMACATRSIDIAALRNNAALIAEAAKTFEVPTIVTTVAEKQFSGPTFEEITRVLPGRPSIDRTTMNAWEDANVVEAINRIGKGKGRQALNKDSRPT